jgi:hypothetical protein
MKLFWENFPKKKRNRGTVIVVRDIDCKIPSVRLNKRVGGVWDINILQNELEKLKVKIFNLKQKPPGQRRPSRTGLCGLYGPIKDPIELHVEKLEDVHRQVRQCQMEFRQKKKVSLP